MRGSRDDSVGFRRSLRRTSTWAERRVWRALRSRQHERKWRRQHPVGPYVLDFFCVEERIGIELDGDPHFTPERQARDATREAFLAAHGIRVLRFTNEQVYREADAVLETIWGDPGA